MDAEDNTDTPPLPFRIVQEQVRNIKMDDSGPRKRKVLFLSDSHIGGVVSNFAAYQQNLIEKMTQYDDVVMIGDSWELFYVDEKHVRALSQTVDSLTGKGAKWKKELKQSGDMRDAVGNVVRTAAHFTKEFLERYPDVHLHVVGGNHEELRKLHNEFKELQDKYDNFEWSPVAVRIGDAMATHGHLPMDAKLFNPDNMPRLRDTEDKPLWKFIKASVGADFIKSRAVGGFARVEHQWELYRRKPEQASKIVLDQLKQWDGKGVFFASHNRLLEPLDMSQLKHVFIGHTHHKIDNHKVQGHEILVHNTGAITKSNSQRPEGLGILEADLQNGEITNVRPVMIAKDSSISGNGQISR
jgi:predicted phosphodiesterase